MLPVMIAGTLYFSSPQPIQITKVESRYSLELAEQKKQEVAPVLGIVKVKRDKINNCVVYAKRQTGITRPLGLGGNGHVQGQEPRIGSIGVLPGHAVVVKGVSGSKITFYESNYLRDWITKRSLDRSRFLGFIYS